MENLAVRGDLGVDAKKGNTRLFIVKHFGGKKIALTGIVRRVRRNANDFYRTNPLSAATFNLYGYCSPISECIASIKREHWNKDTGKTTYPLEKNNGRKNFVPLQNTNQIMHFYLKGIITLDVI